MHWKSMIALGTIVVLALGAAIYRPSDSSHAIGLINRHGGKARHGFMLESGQRLYTLIATATVLPPVRGDVRVALQGEPVMDYAIYDSKPVIDFGLHRRPHLENNVLHAVQPRDRLALWVVMRPQGADGNSTGLLSPPTPLTDNSAGTNSPLALVFNEVRSGNEVLRIPVHFTDLMEARHGH